jgi:hypothetical protein
MTDSCPNQDPENDIVLEETGPVEIEVVVKDSYKAPVNPWQVKFDRVKHRRSKEWCDRFRKVVLKQDPE